MRSTRAVRRRYPATSRLRLLALRARVRGTPVRVARLGGARPSARGRGENLAIRAEGVCGVVSVSEQAYLLDLLS
jgi:hypothetical protein